MTCSAPGCGRPVPAGLYLKRQKHFFCCKACGSRYRPNYEIGVCLHCNGPIIGPKYQARTRRFCCNEHQLLYRGRRHTKARAGVHGEILDEYLHGFAKVHYKPRAWSGIRNSLVAFLEYLSDQEISNLEDAGPKLITAYIAAEAKRGIKSHAYVSAIKTFFDWMLAEGRRNAPNPVVNHIHRVRGNWGPPRPFSESEMALMSKLIEERGSPLLKLAFAIGEECGLRISEVNNIRLEDVDAVVQRIYVRTPNKTDTPRRPFYDERVKHYLAEWMRVRDPHCGHRLLLHKGNSRPIKDVAHLQVELKKILTAGLLYETGVERFAFHRLRHTWASRLAEAGTDIAVIMELGGWKSLAGVSRYIRISDQRKEESYRTAMRKLREERELGSETSISIADLAAMSVAAPAIPPQSALRVMQVTRNYASLWSKEKLWTLMDSWRTCK